jgi:GNAT superfamily N-acetyltransferase
LTSVMTLAFAADPVARWMYHDPRRYLAYFGRFIRAFAGRACSAGRAWSIDGHLGAALRLPPGVEPDEDAIATILDESIPRDVMADVNAMFDEMSAYHPGAPHWYLPTIAIESHFHGKGFGSALLAETLGRCARNTCRPTWNPAILPTRRCTGDSDSRDSASYAPAIRRPWSRCSGAHADKLKSKPIRNGSGRLAAGMSGDRVGLSWTGRL